MVWLRKLQGGGNSYNQQAWLVKATHPTRDPYSMDIDRINLSPSERTKHIHDCKCFICHKEGCHSPKHSGWPKGRGKPPQQGAQIPWRAKAWEVDGDPQVANFIKQKGISVQQAIDLLGNYYSWEPASSWEELEEELVARLSVEGFRKRRMDQCHHFPQTFNLYL